VVAGSGRLVHESPFGRGKVHRTFPFCALTLLSYEGGYQKNRFPKPSLVAGSCRPVPEELRSVRQFYQSLRRYRPSGGESVQ
jgi:hypothetical protein